MESKKINQLATNVAPQTSDLTIIGDPITGVSKKITLLQIADLFATTGTVTSVGVTETGNALTITGSPITSAGTINIGFAGDATQYVRGDGALADFPTSTGGGSSVSYYLNSSVSQGTIGGVAYREFSKDPIAGAGTDITASTNGYIASYLTDANDPALLEVPGGNFNCEFYFSVNSNAHNPYVYAELYKYDGTTFTLLGSSQSVPEYLTNGTTLSPYYFAIPVTQTTLAITDRIAIRIYVNVDTKVVTLHTENNHLCQVVTTFSKGLTSLNNLTRQVQFLATGTSGTDFNISSSTATHTFNIPNASATNRGLITTEAQTIAGAKVFDNPITGNSGIAFLNGVMPNITSNLYSGIGGNSQGISIITRPVSTNYTNNFYFPSASNSYTFPNATGTIALTTDLSAYLPLSGGTLTGTTSFDGSGATTNPITLIFNTGINRLLTPVVRFYGATSIASNYVELFGTNATSNRTIQFPDASGTIAITSDLSAYLPLTGGTLTGALNLNYVTPILRLTDSAATGNNGNVFLRAEKSGVGYNTLNYIAYEHIFKGGGSESTFLTINSAGAASFSSTVTATSLIKSGGTSSQFLKADGSVDSSTYLTTGSAASTYLPLSGGTMTGQIVLKESSSSSDFTKGLRFPNDPFGGSDDIAGLRLYNSTGENMVLELYTGNDGASDVINFATGIGGTANNDSVKINGNKIWNAGNLATPITGTGTRTIYNLALFDGSINSIANSSVYEVFSPEENIGVYVGNTLKVQNALVVTGNINAVAATLTGALSGTSATFSSSVTANGIFYGTSGVTDPTAGTNAGTSFALNGNSIANNYSIGLTALRNSAYDIFFQTGAANGGGYRWYIGTSEKMTMTSAGRIVINDTVGDTFFNINTKSSVIYTPNGFNGVNAGFRLTNGSVGAGKFTGLSFTGGGSTEGFFGVVQNSSGLAEFVWQTFNGSAYGERMRISSTGQLQVKQAGNGFVADGLGFINTSGNAWNLVAGGDNNFYIGYNFSAVGYFSSSTGAYVPLSDTNKKKDFEQSTIGLNAILSLKPTLYRMKTDNTEGNKELGFIAQEVKEFIPQAYVESEKFIGLNYNPIVAALVKSVQELEARIKQLENK
jgi:hypothetical protein